MRDVKRTHMADGEGYLLCRPFDQPDMFELTDTAELVTCQRCRNKMSGRPVCAPIEDAPEPVSSSREFHGYRSADYCGTCGLSSMHWSGCADAAS